MVQLSPADPLELDNKTNDKQEINSFAQGNVSRTESPTNLTLLHISMWLILCVFVKGREMRPLSK